jgi:hypothetical protein
MAFCGLWGCASPSPIMMTAASLSPIRSRACVLYFLRFLASKPVASCSMRAFARKPSVRSSSHFTWRISGHSSALPCFDLANDSNTNASDGIYSPKMDFDLIRS